MPLGNIAWHTLFRQDADRIPDAIADYRMWLAAALDVLEELHVPGDHIARRTRGGVQVLQHVIGEPRRRTKVEDSAI